MIAATERSNKELVALRQEARNMLNTRFGQISGSLANLEKKIDVAQAALLRRGDDFYTAYSFYIFWPLFCPESRLTFFGCHSLFVLR